MRKVWLKLPVVFRRFSKYEIYEKSNTLESHSPSNGMCQIWLKLA